ncbi:MAG: DNA repair protein RecO [Calditrichaeota bacterium]|nr:MAG: DNA repair protein RecO [Calditrichota bacterium]
MALVKTEAIILRSMKLGETSKLLTLYARKSGILKLVAKGARQSKSRLMGSLEPLYVVEVVYYEKESRELQILSQVSIVYVPKYVFTDADKTVLALACGEMVTRLEKPGDVNPGVYGLLRATLEAFDQPDVDARLIFLAFQLRLLEHIGLSPGLQKCFGCETSETSEGRYDFANARLYCERCAQKTSQGKEIKKETLQVLRELLRLPLRKIGHLQWQASIQAEIYRFLTSFYHYHLEEMGALKSIAVLAQMKSLANATSSQADSNKESS